MKNKNHDEHIENEEVVIIETTKPQKEKKKGFIKNQISSWGNALGFGKFSKANNYGISRPAMEFADECREEIRVSREKIKNAHNERIDYEALLKDKNETEWTIKNYKSGYYSKLTTFYICFPAMLYAVYMIGGFIGDTIANSANFDTFLFIMNFSLPGFLALVLSVFYSYRCTQMKHFASISFGEYVKHISINPFRFFPGKLPEVPGKEE